MLPLWSFALIWLACGLLFEAILVRLPAWFRRVEGWFRDG